jgi:hypothetical protein
LIQFAAHLFKLVHSAASSRHGLQDVLLGARFSVFPVL